VSPVARSAKGRATFKSLAPNPNDLLAETRTLLDPRLGPLQPAVRAELFGAERFRQHGISLAQAQPIRLSRGWRWRDRQQSFSPRLHANVQVLERARNYLEMLDRLGESRGLAGEWLLDNFHLIEAQATEIRNGLPPSYYSKLPKLVDAPLAGLPRVYGIAWAFVAHTDSGFDAPLLKLFLQAYQEVDALTLGELWAIPVNLRIVLMENLARLADGIARHRAAQQVADWCCRQQESDVERHLEATCAGLVDPALRSSFLAQVALRVRANDPGAWSTWLEAKKVDADALLARVQDGYAADNVSVSNAVSALHAISRVNWQDLIGQVSPVLQTLSGSAAFVAESDLTRDQCTHAIERLAQRLNQRELDIARTVLRLSTEAEQALAAGPAYWLIGGGRPELIRAVGGHLAAIDAPAWARLLRRLRGPLYAAFPLAGALLLLVLLFDAGAGDALQAVMLLLTFLVGFEILITLVNRVLAEALPVSRLPRLALEQGLEEEHRTLVVVPCMLTSQSTVRALAKGLERAYLANPEKHTRFALLSDWRDASEPHAAEDEELLAAARKAIESLNLRYPQEGLSRFALLHRERVWCDSEGVWMGWERKRGKIEQLLGLLAQGKDSGASPFLDLGRLSQTGQGVRFLVTIDSDTEMPPRSLREMVSIAAHPLNRPRLDPDTRRVVAGYGILQPRIAAPLPKRSEITAFGWLFSAPWGFDFYNSGSSEIYQDLFSQGSFSGKGLLDVHAVHQSLQGHAPPDCLLSHDLYEGIWANAAYLSDVALMEQNPMLPEVSASRTHRWTRGDWQLLALLWPALRGRVGALNVWKMMDNLRRSLLAPACLVLLWLSFATGAPEPLHALLLVAAAFGLGPLIGALAGLFPGRSDLAWPHFLREGAADLMRAVGGTLWLLATLPGAAALQVDAIARAIWRMTVSRRQLLEWTTAAQVQASARLDWATFWRRHLGPSLLAAAWTATGVVMPEAHLPWLLGTGAIWLLSPVWLWAVSQPLHAPEGRALEHPDTRDYLTQLATDTWGFFEETVRETDHHLPADNLQLDPERILAHRTSPTNVGLYMASCVCARELGLIDTPGMALRLQKTLATLEALPRWHGHFYNWTDTVTLQPLMPRYVSTVDSGNLVACLWAVAQACTELAAKEDMALEEDGRLSMTLRSLADGLNRLADTTDFSHLYDRERRLFHIGYRTEDARLDPAYYDLLASESRLTSYVAIAKGDVAPAHWRALGRPFLAVGDTPTLRSWSGSMFEYLMPSLLMREPEGGLLQRVAQSAVRAHQNFGAHLGVPWGVSECAFFEQDNQFAFQYGPFGVPQLALRRTPLEDLVVAPYASVLALMVDLPNALNNLRALEQQGARDRLGFIESLDFSASRLDGRGQHRRVFAYMAHHQGMSLLSLCNLLRNGAPQGWFERSPKADAARALMHECLPREIVYQAGAIPRPLQKPGTEHLAASVRVMNPAAMPPSAMPTALLGNGSYSLNLRPNGAGQSQWNGIAINRSRDDLLRDLFGHWMLLRPAGQAHFGSLTLAPCQHPDAGYEARYFEDRVEFAASTAGWKTRMDIWVSPDDPVELRQVELHNLKDEIVDFELMGMFEVALAAQPADEAHPAFSKMFVQAHAVGQACLVLQRQPRSDGERAVWVAYFLASCSTPLAADGVTVRCNRAQLLSGRGAPAPAPSAPDAELDTGLDPMASLSVRLRLQAHGRTSVVIATAAAADSATLMALVDEYRQEMHVTRSKLKAAALARIRRRDLRLEASELRAIQDMATSMAMSRSRGRPLGAAALDRSALWRFSISGDRPIALIHIRDSKGLPAVRSLLVAQRLWAIGGLVCDLVVLDAEVTSYLMPLRGQLNQLRDSVAAAPDLQGSQGGVFILRQSEVSPVELATLRGRARLELVATDHSLERLVTEALGIRPDKAGDRVGGESAQSGWPARQRKPLGDLPPTPQAIAEAQFTDGGRAFDIRVDAGRATPRPWANVMANPHFGCIVTESGGGFTWARNSRTHQLTPWSNDPVLDPPGEHFLVHDKASGEVFSLMPTGDRNGAEGYRVSHQAGMSTFSQLRGSLEVECRVMVHPQESAKCVSLRLTNRGPHRRLRLVAMVEWVMGTQRSDRMFLQTEYCPDQQAVLSRQMEHDGGFGEGTAFLILNGHAVSEWTCERNAFFDRQGDLRLPEVLRGAHGFGLDPCGALASDIDLASEVSMECCWVLGYGLSRSAALALVGRLREPGELAQLSQQVTQHWNGLLSSVSVVSPDPAFDALVNHWLLYQTLSCRLWARAGFYQVSGATGFRDQLQDALALASQRPDLLRAQLLLHASRQFLEGDVQHWWHAPTGVGVRTHFSDDLLWLAFAIHHYGRVSGDWDVLDVPVSFLEGPPVPDGAEDAYFMPTDSGRRECLFEHAARAIDVSLRTGAHGLPLMGSGDWNDGMNRVGHGGRGESVWLAMFLLVILRDWIPLARRRGQEERAKAWQEARDQLEVSLAEHGWDGDWFRRAYFDNGHPLGSHQSSECKIDLIAQAWSVFALPKGDPRAEQAMQSADALLVDRGTRLLRLLDPPLQDAADRAGYIQAYPPGVRENGGQYSHGAVWAVIAQAKLGNAELAWEYFRMLSPAHRAPNAPERLRYGLEPYVMAGDVCSAPPRAAQGGWSWYTGSSAWMYRAAVEYLVGLRVESARFCLLPCLPSAWAELRLHIRMRGKDIHVLMHRGQLPLETSDGVASNAAKPIQVAAGQWVHFEDLAPTSELLVALPPSSA
jgi:cyclic beta-1,2-glucan synthetase